jgi:BlaI family transcriptional regulator, penicillinase repressor
LKRRLMAFKKGRFSATLRLFFQPKIKIRRFSYKNLRRIYSCFSFVYEMIRISMLMNNQPNPQPTDAELDILHVLWEQGPCTVREVNEVLTQRAAEGKVIGYTTTLKLMQIMSEKGLVTRDTQSRTHLYQSAFAQEKVQANLLERFVNSAFRGSATQLALHALGHSQPSDEELHELKRLIEDFENRKP